MSLHYDLRLKQLLPANNGDSEIVLNREFGKWEQYIDGRIRESWTWQEMNQYRALGQHKEFDRACNEHAKSHQGQINAHRVVVLVHPFYLFSGNMNYVEGPQEHQEATQYLMRLTAFLRARPSPDVLGVVALENLPHYAAITSRLLEVGMVDRVVFTRDDSGYTQSPKDLNILKGKTLFYGGLHNEGCVSEAIQEMQTANGGMFSGEKNEQGIFVIKNLTLNVPSYIEGLAPRGIMVGKEVLPENRLVRLEDVVESAK